MTVQEDQTPVTHIRVVVQLALTPSDNHWSIYLLHAGGRSSTRINMRANFGDPKGILEWTRHGYIQTTSAIAFWDFPVAAGITVLYFARLIYSLGRERYDMSGGGSGCRWWVYTIMSDLSQRNYIHQTAPSQIWPNLLFIYHWSKERKPLQMVQGVFY
ncbi:hypothetical protein DPV78_010611 [Talaromyces pinophilus]|nr:hypothetical protein DPV78_010611 [Talaromyces pinophilus]